MKFENHSNNTEITDRTVENIARLARIRLDGDEAAKIKNELIGILEYTDVLNSLDTDGIEPMSHVFDIANVLRDDVVRQSFNVDGIVKNAPVHTADSFVVPKTLE